MTNAFRIIRTILLLAGGAFAISSLGGESPAAQAAEAPAWYVKKATVQETWTASLAAMPAAKIELGPWYYIGPFDNAGGKGFNTVYEPEKKVDHRQSCTGLGGKPLSWREGKVFGDGVINDLRIFEVNDHVTAYVHRTITVSEEMNLPVDLGSDDTLTVWLNGKKLLSQNVTRACGLEDARTILPLRKGRNELLMKICQGDGGFGFAFTPRSDNPRDEALRAALLTQIRADFGKKADELLFGMQMEKEYRLQFDALKKDLADRAWFEKIASQTFREASLITKEDRDPADVVLRRTAALLVDLVRLPGCPDLASPAKELETLAKKGREIAPSDKDGRYALFTEACALRRRIAFANPLLNFDKVLFAEHHRKPNTEFQGHHMCDQYFGFKAVAGGGIFVLEKAFSAAPVVRDVLAGATCANGRFQGKPLTPGAFLSPDLSYDGKEIVFAYTEIDRQKWFQWLETTTYHLFKVAADGSGLTQLTDGKWSDFHPAWMPNGRIVFMSERRGGFGRCHGRPVPTWTLHTMQPDGGDIQCISFHETNEWHPSINNDGMIVYTRWDYVDRGFNQAHHPWITTPEGLDARAIHGNYPPNFHDRPTMELNCRAIPSSRKYVTTAAAHHGQAFGSLVLIDPAVKDDDKMAPVKRITPEARFPESERADENYGTAWPLSEDYYLCVWDPNGFNRGSYGLYLVDSFGNRELLYRNEAIGCMYPIPLQARPTPPVVPPSAVAKTSTPDAGTMALMNVYDSLKPWPADAKIVALRVVQVLPKSTPVANVPQIGYGSQKNARVILGTVPVESDGSAYFEVPAGKPVYFQALDDRGMAVQSMRSDTYVRAGQHISCQGCHEPKAQAPRKLPDAPLALRRAASKIEPEKVDGVSPFNFVRLMQPVLDRDCVPCHSKNAKAPKLADNAGNKKGWSQSYINLKPYAFYFDHNDFNVSRTTPGQFGARASKLLSILQSAPQHKDLKLPAEDFHRITLWLDSNSDFYGAYENTEAQARGEIVKPSLE